ncbi:SsgA family sporulation/cell division regulator [Streptomyces sp. NPDC094153]|uniref:SsgA family sporulation/cell division regulator n=1 Tax=Streptomyces sp. NPDC094153 TaxID=3366058 RepID=UPI00380F17BD
MNAMVRKSLVVQLQAHGTERFPVLAHLDYDAEDPFAVTIVFAHDGRVLARWKVDRGMLEEGLGKPVGVGDVRFRPVSDGLSEELCMEFFGDAHTDGERQHATVFVWAAAVGAFLRDTYAVVAPGEEDARVDNFLAEVLTGS